jgi:hypothetical protein
MVSFDIEHTAYPGTGQAIRSWLLTVEIRVKSPVTSDIVGAV